MASETAVPVKAESTRTSGRAKKRAARSSDGTKRWRLTDQPLAVQFLTAGGVVAFFSVVSLVLLLSQVDSQTKASRFLSQTHQAVGKLNTLGRDFYRQETAGLEYLRARDARYLASVHEQRQLWDEGIKEVRVLAASNERETELLHGLEESYHAWLKVTDALISQSTPDPEALRNESALFKETFLLIDHMINLENRQLVLRDEREKSATSATFTAIGLIQVVLMVIFGIVLAKLYFSIARPISDLSTGMRRYREGDFTARVPVSNASQIGYLELSFNEMAEKIEFMVDDLRKLDQLKTEFISTVSHELRTPLTSIGGYAKLLAGGEAGSVTDTQKEFLYIIDTNVVRLTHLINDILDVEKMEVGKMQIVREPIAIAPVLKECRDTFGILAAQKGLDLKYDVPDELQQIMGDRSRLVQIFMNLLSNSIKYTEKGFVELKAEANDFAVTVKVRDSGVGLSAEETEKVFQKFYRTPSGLNSAEGGSGLGLAIVRGLVEAHGGTITVDSQLGKGTTFTVTFPATSSIVQIEVDDGVAAASGRADSAVPSWQRPIWVIDSDSAVVEQMGRVIENAGPLFKGYRLGLRAFASIDEVPESVSPDGSPFMVILDPGTDGDPHQAIPRLRRRLHRTVPILVVSGTVDTAEVFAEGASALLTKPIDEREFLMAVKEMITAKGWRVLVAERNTDLRILLKRALEQRGFLVDDVDRGSQVMSRIEQEDYDLALLDLDFTDVSARELLKVIRRGRSKDTLPVLVMVSENKSVPSNSELEAWGVNASVGKVRGIGGIVDSVTQYLEDKKSIEQPS
jgi:signal transduction histidine kinase/DNA-binding response OmpR family regulator